MIAFAKQLGGDIQTVKRCFCFVARLDQQRCLEIRPGHVLNPSAACEPVRSGVLVACCAAHVCRSALQAVIFRAQYDAAQLTELFRVMAPRGRLFILINLYKDNEYSLQWVDKLKVPVHVRSQAEYVELSKNHAFENVEACRVPDDTPTPDDYKTKSFHSLEDLKAFKREGALLLMATKPDPRGRRRPGCGGIWLPTISYPVGTLGGQAIGTTVK
jgi:hypothetical protein